MVRDPATGFCVEANVGEPGEAIGELKDRAAGSFDGYLGNKKATEKKILRDVFKKGDAYFRTGDLLMVDDLGYYYFVDRIGDTFRWKGENVATTEVASVLASVGGVLEMNVYGAAIPGQDGRACMVAAVLDENADEASVLSEMLRRAREQLPAYAVPLFIRILPRLDVTGTFKHRKVELREQGADLYKVGDDRVYFLPHGASAYVILDRDTHASIFAGKISRL